MTFVFDPFSNKGKQSHGRKAITARWMYGEKEDENEGRVGSRNVIK